MAEMGKIIPFPPIHPCYRMRGCSTVAEMGKIIPFPPIHPCYRNGWFVKMLERIRKPKEKRK